MKLSGFVLAALHCVAALVTDAPKYGSSCRNITFTVQASATNIIVDKPSDSDLSSTANVNAYLQALPITVINGLPGKRGGTFKLAGVYCIPQFPASRFEGRHSPLGDVPLQILIHGSTYTKEYWSRGAWGDTNNSYSWSWAAGAAGYATLAVDKLGAGLSSHPDPILDVQLPLQMETIHALITQIKAGRTKIPKPKTVILVGHASGSSLGASLAETYPEDVDAVVLTAYTPGSSINQSLSLSQQYAPAAISDPQRFGNLSYGYLLPGSLAARTDALYYEGHYDPAIALNDYASRDVHALGERFDLGPKTQPDYKGKVLVVTGANDQFVCGAIAAQQCSLIPDAIMNVNATFSSSTGFEYYMPQTGRSINWHYQSLITFDVTFQKLDYLIGRSSAGWRVAMESSS